MWQPNDIHQICIVGGGNASQVLAAILGHAREHGSGIRVSMLAPFGSECDRLRAAAQANGGITIENPDGTTLTGMPDLITKDPKEALLDTQIVLLPLPTFAMPPMCELIAPHLEYGTWAGALPAQGGFQWIAGNILDISPEGKAIKLFGLDKLPYNCRAVEYGKYVKVFGYKEVLALASIPNIPELSSTMAKTVSASIPKLDLFTVPNFLDLTLSPANQCIHPARMYGLFHKVQTRDRLPLFYEEMDDESADMIESVSNDIQAIARALEKCAKQSGQNLDLSGVLTVREATLKVYDVDDDSSLKRIFATCHGFKGILAPMKKVVKQNREIVYEVDWNNRYFREDIPALCVAHGLAEIAGIEVPAIDKLIKWAQPHFAEPYEFLKSDGKLNTDRQKLMYTPQYWGIQNKEQLLRFHGSDFINTKKPKKDKLNAPCSSPRNGTYAYNDSGVQG